MLSLELQLRVTFLDLILYQQDYHHQVYSKNLQSLGQIF